MTEYMWNVVSESSDEHVQHCEGCTIRDAETLYCKVLQTKREDTDIACAKYSNKKA